jgi:hypothetical protein
VGQVAAVGVVVAGLILQPQELQILVVEVEVEVFKLPVKLAVLESSSFVTLHHKAPQQHLAVQTHLR